MKRFGIERQALAVALIPVLILAVLLESAFLYFRLDEQEQILQDRAELIAQQLASSSEFAVFSANRSVLQQLTEGVLWQKDVIGVRLYDTDGKTLSVAGGAHWNNAPSRQAGEGGIWQDEQSLRVIRPIVSTRLVLDDSAAPATDSAASSMGGVELVMSKRRLSLSKFELVVFSLLLTALVLLVSVLAAMRVARRITLPIFGMRAALRDLGDGRLDTRVGEMQVSELNDLGQGINQMASRLQQQQEHLQQRIEQATHALREKKEEAEKANFDKTRFLAAASHDLRQPMHALGLFMGELRQRINTPEQRQIVDKAEEAVSAMSGLLESLLDISKLDAGVIVPQLQEIDMTVLANRLLSVFGEQAAQKFITLRVRCSSARVVSDPILLERILLNLLGNAIRYTPQHGTVMLACRRQGDHLCIEIRDNGGGIAPEDQKKIFQEFVQLENAARDRSKGLGLGLPIVQRLCRLLQHPLSLRSAPGVGTTFRIEVPLVQGLRELLAQPSRVLSSPLQDPGGFGGIKVLVVDDDELVRRGTGGLVASWGCEVVAAATLAEVMQKKGESFALVICDYRLPDGDGLMLFDYIWTHCTAKPAFILISGDTSPGILQQVAAHKLHFLHKPVRPAKLRSMMNALLRQNQDEAS